MSKSTNVHLIEEGKSRRGAKLPMGPDPKFDSEGRVRLPPLPRTGKKQKPQVDCACGCGMQTRSRFVPGHDSYLRGWVLRVERGIVKLSEVPEQHQAAVKREMKARKAETPPVEEKKPKAKRVRKPKAPKQEEIETAQAEQSTEE